MYGEAVGQEKFPLQHGLPGAQGHDAPCDHALSREDPACARRRSLLVHAVHHQLFCDVRRPRYEQLRRPCHRDGGGPPVAFQGLLERLRLPALCVRGGARRLYRLPPARRFRPSRTRSLLAAVGHLGRPGCVVALLRRRGLQAHRHPEHGDQSRRARGYLPARPHRGRRMAVLPAGGPGIPL